MKNIVLICGPSGSGISTSEYVFEELGYFIIKNVPSELINAVLDKLVVDKDITNACIIVNVSRAKSVYSAIKNRKDANYRFIALNCDKDEILKRYALTRHVHPRSVSEKVSIEKAVEKDIYDVLDIKSKASYYIDTTSLSIKELRERLYKYLANVEQEQITHINFISFGIKNGIPQGIDTFFDVRLIPNPYWVQELRELSGEDQEVIDYMMSFDVTKELLDSITSYLSTYLKELQKKGRGSYTIGVGCSGGQHRSTFVANYLANYFAKEYRTEVTHRDKK